jgi:hypothetical protein|nr:MAG TPA: hypothetical protein [Caudoviricetes sp.]
MESRGSVVLKRIPRTPTVSILPGERVFHKLPDGTYDPPTITLEAVVNNVDKPKYQWGHIVSGNFQPYSVVYSHMIASPVHAGVVAVKVTGDNVLNAIIASETLTIVEDGVSPVQYKIVVKQLDRIVTSISCDANGSPKLYYQATAYLYKITGDTEELCEDFQCVVVYYKDGTRTDTSISTSPTGSYVFNVSGDYDLIRVGFTDLEAGKDIIETSLAKVYDGQPGISYDIVFTQGNAVVDSIACTNDGYPKLDPDVSATLYKVVGGKKLICSDYYPSFEAYDYNNELTRVFVDGSPGPSVEFGPEREDEMYFSVYFSDSSKNIIAQKSITKVLDGNPGKKGNDGCAIRRSEWKLGVEYRNDESITAITRYLDVVMVRANNALGWRGYKCLETHVSTTDNAPGNTTYWEELPTNAVGILTSIIIARDAKLDFLSGNEIRILDANDKVTAGVSGSGSGDTGIRFYAGSDNPQNAPFRVDENGKVIATDGEFIGKVETSISGQRIVINPLTKSLKMYSPEDLEVINMSFDNEYNMPSIEVYSYKRDGKTPLGKTSIHGSAIRINYLGFDPDVYTLDLDPVGGILFKKNEVITKAYYKE